MPLQWSRICSPMWDGSAILPASSIFPVSRPGWVFPDPTGSYSLSLRRLAPELSKYAPATSTYEVHACRYTYPLSSCSRLSFRRFRVTP